MRADTRRLPSERALTIGVGLLLAALCAACDASFTSPPVSAVCAQIGAQCQLPGGPLGVCQQIACAAGATPPCFACTSQH